MDFKAIVKEQRQELEEIEREEKIIERKASVEGKAFLKYPNILAVIGVRRCGKSIFSYLLAKESKFGYINFDDERLAEVKAEELDGVLQAFYGLYGDVEYVVLDEIQNVEKWELFANRLRRTKKVIITGSNSKLLAGELSTHLTGRHLDVTLFPFSFAEFLKSKGVEEKTAYTSKEKSEILALLKRYVEIGGFPEAKKFGKAILQKIYEDIIFKDALFRYKIRKREEFRKTAKYLVTNSCGETTYSKLAENLGIKHVATVSNWISCLEESFLVFKLERFSFKLKQQFLSPKKIYCIDTGIVNAVGFKFSENFGKAMENAVAVELQREKTALSTEVYYWKNHQQNEVDFVCKKGTRVTQLIQVTNATGKSEIDEREVNALIKASKELKCTDLLIVTWDYEGEIQEEGKTIRCSPLWKWLLKTR